VPVAALLTNFPDGLMEHAQVETYLHEFGHLLHWLFAGQRPLASQNFGEIENDVIEAPSTLLEEWVWDYDTLAKFATDAKGQPIPRELVAKMVAGRNFGRAFGTMTQLGLTAVSLDYYSNDVSNVDLTKRYMDTFGRYGLMTYPEGSHNQANFGHLSGYGASYYTYQWSEALAADLLSRFRTAGLRDRATARAYREMILAPGGSDSMNVLARDFLGRDWSVDAYRKELETGAN
jgi:thimet oligopeptidase